MLFADIIAGLLEIRKLKARTRTAEERLAKAEQTIANMEARLKGTLRGVTVKCFDPFQNSGGRQSFATALISEKGEGVVLSGIHARDGVRVYAKEIHRFSSERELSEEERDAIETAKKKLYSA